ESGGAVDADVTGMLLHDTVSDGEAETGAAADAFRRKERIVNFDHVLGIDADTIVGYLHRQRILFAIVRRQHDAAVSVSDRVTRVENEVGEHLLQLHRIAEDRRQFSVVLADNLDLATAQLRLKQLQRVIQHAMNVERSKFGGVAGAGKI